jgi:hypothetical protein
MRSQQAIMEAITLDPNAGLRPQPNRVWSSKIRNSNIEIRNKFEFSKFKISKLSCFVHLEFGHLRLFRISDFVLRIYTRSIMNNLVAILRTILAIRDQDPKKEVTP